MKPNIIFVLLDGSRWDRFHISPELTELQKRGTLLNNVITAIPYTFGSMNVIFTGLYGKENGVDAYYKMFKLKDSVDFLPELLKKNGYYTCCDVITDKVISKRGFDVHQAHDEYNDDLTKKHPDLIREAFNSSKGKPVFCFLQFSRIHTITVSEILKKYKWDNKEFYEKKSENIKTYDNVFTEAGIYAKKIYETVDDLGKLNETILIFFADHGTGVGERFGERNYGVFTYEETIRTPYLFIGPHIPKNRISEGLVSTINIFPTLLELASINYNSTNIGKSFASYLLGKNDLEEDEFAFSETGGLQGPFPSPKEPNVFCVKTKRNKLIFFKATNEWKLFDLQNDPLEQNDVFEKEIQTSQKLKNTLLKWIQR
ncbi:DUF4976 domain-containing protein [Candidatus Nitrosopumilus sp. SW]|uniref:sulfatase family protein n=1 Tax=Candidatus Nitrosopumilus sp. SW TaxID=2508726 RepID=UPI001154E301|nr:sulfatase-like hydrolase/transferase [Candidatus Nitrosopumilus sp. SW]QDI88798.1 DUF4976 domain-containing protein [Candidatus Nitrosopumilus sp. SW]